MPSRRPSAPRPSARRPFTVTGAPTAPVSRACDLGPARRQLRRLGARRCSPRCPASSRPPAPRRSPRRSSSSAVGAGPWRGSVSGKCWPMSPSPAAPSSASATAWATTSASLWPSRPRSPVEPHAAEHERARRVVAEAVHVEALPDPHTHGRAVLTLAHRRLRSSTRRRAHARSSGRVTLRLSARRRRRPPVPPTASTSAASSVPSRPARVGLTQRVGAERLGRLHRHEPATGRCPDHPAGVVDLLDGVGQRRCPGTAPSAPPRTASTTARTGRPTASGRAASCTTRSSALVGDSRRPAAHRRRSASLRRRPTSPATCPVAAASGPRRHRRPRRGAVASDQSSTRRPPSGSYCFGPPKRAPRAGGDDDGPHRPPARYRRARGSTVRPRMADDGPAPASSEFFADVDTDDALASSPSWPNRRAPASAATSCSPRATTPPSCSTS